MELKKEAMFNEAKEKLQRSIEYYQRRIEAWGKVQRVYKKDGTSFKNLSQNFINCKFENQFNDLVIKVYYTQGGYQDDYISIKQLVDYSPVQPKEGQEIIKQSCLKPYFYADADQLEELIKKQIENYKKWLKEAENDYATFIEVFPEFYKKIEDIRNFVDNIAIANSGLEFRLKECIKKLY